MASESFLRISLFSHFFNLLFMCNESTEIETLSYCGATFYRADFFLGLNCSCLIEFAAFRHRPPGFGVLETMKQPQGEAISCAKANDGRVR